MSKFKFSVGPWNVHPGADSYGPETRKDIPVEERFVCMFGTLYIEFADTFKKVCAFTEQGVAMLATVLRTKVAEEVSIRK